MKFGFGGGITLIVFFIISCDSIEKSNDTEFRNSDLISLEIELKTLQDSTSSYASQLASILLGDPTGIKPYFPGRNYLYFDNQMLYNPQNNGYCSVIGFGSPTLSESQFNNLWALEKFEPRLKDIVEGSTLADRAYILTRDDLGFIYPFTDVIAYFSPEHNLHEDQVLGFNLAKQSSNANVAWTTPYLDAGGLGYVISVIAIIKIKQEIIGTFSLDIPVKKIHNNLLKNAGAPTLIVSSDTVLVAANKQSLALFPFESLDNPYYLKQTKSLTLPPDKYNLNHNPSSNIQKFARMIFGSSHFQITLEDNQFTVYSTPIRYLGWRLVKLTYD